MGTYYNQLTLNDRLTLEKLLKANKYTKQEIADTIGCKRITIYREIEKGTIEGIDTNLNPIKFYSGDTAHRIYTENKKKQGAKLKPIKDKKLMSFVEKKIEKDRYSPRATVMYIKNNNLKFKYYISDFTIYNYIKKGYFKNLTMEKLPYAKTYHKHYQKLQKRASFGLSIEKRPKEILSREEFGHWEMDSVEGSENSKKSLLVLSERKTRKELIFINDNMTSNEVVSKINILEKELKNNFKHIFKDITVDNGKEFADAKGLSLSIRNKNTNRLNMYYCHPGTPTERGTNENINKMIRKYIPKGTNFDNYKNTRIKRIQEEINNYPRKLFNSYTANDKFIEELQKIKISPHEVPILFH